MLSLVILIQYQHVIDTHDDDSICRANIVPRGKN